MGCDIHMVLEERDDEFGWVGINAFHGHRDRKGSSSWPGATDRHYKRFAALAGVRGEGPEPKGIPDDASPLTRLEIKGWGGDGHSHSWLPISEAAKIFSTRFYETEMPLDPKSYEADYPAEFWFGASTDTASLENYRLIFWFDN
jgi:hypothetical protein